MSVLPPATIIVSDEELAEHAARWAAEPLLAIDTESNSLYAYREQVCLIQLSTRTADFIIDPLEVADLSPLAPILADPGVEKVFHAAEYDLMCLKRDFDFTFAGLFDTMLAARICGEGQLGLASMLSAHFGVEVDKKHQRADWGARPLSPELLHYAQLDTHFLPLLRDLWKTRLEEQGRWPEAREAFGELARIPPAERHFDPEGFWRINGAQDLSPRQLSLIRELYLLREQLAKARDVPPFKIFDDRALLALAQVAPHHLGDLPGLPGMSALQIRRYGRDILRAVQRGETSRPPTPHRHPRPDPHTLIRYEALRNWRKQRAQERGVESDVIVPRDALWELARRAPTSLEELSAIPGLGPWKVQAYGVEILQVIASANGGGKR